MNPNTPTGTPTPPPSEDGNFSEARYQTNEAELLALFARCNPVPQERSKEASLSRIQGILDRAKADVKELKSL